MKIRILAAILTMAPLGLAGVASAQIVPDQGSPNSSAGMNGPIVPDSASGGSSNSASPNNVDGVNGGINPPAGTGTNPLGPGAAGQPSDQGQISAPDNASHAGAGTAAGQQGSSTAPQGAYGSSQGAYGPNDQGAAVSGGQLHEVTGTVVGSTPTTLTLQDNGMQFEFGIGPSTSFLQNGKVVSADELKEGQTVRAALAPNRGIPFAVAVAIPGGGEKGKAAPAAKQEEQTPAPQQAAPKHEAKAPVAEPPIENPCGCAHLDNPGAQGASNGSNSSGSNQGGNVSIYRW